MPFIRSESCWFIWHPNVVTWNVFTADTLLARRRAYAQLGALAGIAYIAVGVLRVRS